MVITKNKDFYKIIEKYKNLYFGNKNLKDLSMTILVLILEY